MKTISPAYYNEFKCIASKCKHNCCIGWEIDIDDFSLSIYDSLKSKMGDKLKSSINVSETGASFILSENKCCPFLDSNGLCEIISDLGEEYLCDICTDHPRFRSYFTDHTEIGVGLCCEEAARIILSSDDNELIVLDDDCENEIATEFEKELLSVRQNVFTLVLKHQKVSDIIEKLTNEFSLFQPQTVFQKYISLLLTLENLEKTWKPLVSKLLSECSPKILPSEDNRYFKRLFHYFLYRHIPSSQNYDDIRVRIEFALLSVMTIYLLYCTHTDKNFEDIVEISRAYSSEIEYSDENLDIIFSFIKDNLNV